MSKKKVKKVAGLIGGSVVDFSTGYAGAAGVGLIVEGIKRKELGVVMTGLTTTAISAYTLGKRLCEAGQYGYEIFSDVVDYDED